MYHSGPEDKPELEGIAVLLGSRIHTALIYLDSVTSNQASGQFRVTAFSLTVEGD